MFIDKRNLYSILFLLVILLLVLFVSKFSFLEGLEGTTTATPVVNATPTTKPVAQGIKPAQVVKPAQGIKPTQGIKPAPVVKPAQVVKPIEQVVQPIAQTTTTTPVIQATTSPVVTTDPIPTSQNTVNNLASVTETPTVSTATIVKISDIQAQVTNLRNILTKDVVIQATDAAKLLQTNPDIQKALSLILDKPVRKEIDILLRNMDILHMNLYLQTMQIHDNLTNLKNQYQNL